jgi:PqqD family protein of HPr-rel-A system
MGDAAQWRSISFKLHWKRWDDEFVVYNSGSGHTHVLDPLAALIVQQMSPESCNASTLIQQLALLLNVTGSEDLRKTVEHTLRQLAELGLVEAVTA